ncbi:MAG: DNA helicase PcrA [Turicibacter sp.]|nr:DNA helicase PcrA [Turicibacter sp.]
MKQLLEHMNPQQAQAIKATEGPLLVMAGAGSGKTRVLTHRIAYLMEEKMVAPWNILAITFTNKAAREMKERVQQLMGESARDVWVSTFHAMCVRILRRDIGLIGYDLNFGILDDADQLSVIKEAMKELGLDPKRQSPKNFLAKISNAKNELLEPKDLNHEETQQEFLTIYKKYQEKLRRNNRVDFDDLLMLTVHLFERHPEVLSYYQNKFQYIHVDEYQDTNKAQYRIVKMLAARFHNVCVVGDSDQSIYSWRGADIQNILSFEKDYPDAAVILLEQNYRSRQSILDAANDVIQNNPDRRDKKLWSDRGAGEILEYHRAQDGDQEAAYIADKIIHLSRDGYGFGDFAVLYRTNSQSRAIEQAMLRQNIPYRLVGGLSFFKRKEIKDLMAYLRLILNPGDDISFLRVVNEPKRGIGGSTLEKLAAYSLVAQMPLMDAIGQGGAGISKAASNKLVEFKSLIGYLRACVGNLSLTELVDFVLEATGYFQMLNADDTIEAHARLDNLEEFKSMAAQFEQEEIPKMLREEGGNQELGELTTAQKLTILLNDLLLQTDVGTEDGDSGPKVTLMTIHASKGLEFPIVFISGFEDGIFPLFSAIEAGGDELEEERRLAYVSITRAMDLLFICNANRRYQHGRSANNPESRFIREISDPLMRKTGTGHRASFLSNDPRPSFSLKEAVESKLPKLPGMMAKVESNWGIGDKLAHDKFGDGIVVAVAGEILTIAFSSEHGIKKLMGAHPALKKRTG